MAGFGTRLQIGIPMPGSRPLARGAGLRGSPAAQAVRGRLVGRVRVKLATLARSQTESSIQLGAQADRVQK